MVKTWYQLVKFHIQLYRSWIFRQFWKHPNIIRTLLVEIEHVRNITTLNPIGHRNILLWKSIPPINRTKASRTQKIRIKNYINFFLMWFENKKCRSFNKYTCSTNSMWSDSAVSIHWPLHQIFICKTFFSRECVFFCMLWTSYFIELKREN